MCNNNFNIFCFINEYNIETCKDRDREMFSEDDASDPVQIPCDYQIGLPLHLCLSSKENNHVINN